MDEHEYLNQLNDFQKKAYLIAQDHLGTSFNIFKSVGYIEYMKNKETIEQKQQQQQQQQQQQKQN